MKKIALLAVFALAFALALAAIRSDGSTGVPNNGSYSSVGVLDNGAQTVHLHGCVRERDRRLLYVRWRANQ